MDVRRDTDSADHHYCYEEHVRLHIGSGGFHEHKKREREDEESHEGEQGKYAEILERVDEVITEIRRGTLRILCEELEEVTRRKFAIHPPRHEHNKEEETRREQDIEELLIKECSQPRIHDLNTHVHTVEGITIKKFASRSI